MINQNSEVYSLCLLINSEVLMTSYTAQVVLLASFVTTSTQKQKFFFDTKLLDYIVL